MAVLSCNNLFQFSTPEGMVKIIRAHLSVNTGKKDHVLFRLCSLVATTFDALP